MFLGPRRNGTKPHREPDGHAAPLQSAGGPSAECTVLGVGAPNGVRNGADVHGGRTKDAVETRKMVNALVRLVRETIE